MKIHLGHDVQAFTVLCKFARMVMDRKFNHNPYPSKKNQKAAVLEQFTLEKYKCIEKGDLKNNIIPVKK